MAVVDEFVSHAALPTSDRQIPMKIGKSMLVASACVLATMPYVAATASQPRSHAFVLFTRALVNSEPLTLEKIKGLIDKLSPRHGVPRIQNWQQTRLLTTDDGQGFDFGNGIVVTGAWMNVYAVTLILSQPACVHMNTLVRLFGPSWKSTLMPDAWFLESYDKGKYHAIVQMSHEFAPECVVRFEVNR